MVTINAQKALMIEPSYGRLSEEPGDLLLIRKKTEDPFNNLLNIDMHDIELLLFQGRPLYGSTELLKEFDVRPEDYYHFKANSEGRFVYGHPEKVIEQIDRILGYHKDLPYLPF